MIRTQVMICGGTGCTSSNSPLIAEAMEREIREKGLENEVKVVRTGCFGLCAMGPVVIVYPDGTFYSLVKLEDVPEIVEEHLLKGRPVERLVHKDIVEGKAVEVESLHDIGFYKPQLRVALRNCGLIDPENIEEYIAMDGYRALGKVLTEMTPEQVIEEITASGLRGRGGAGFPTGKKWLFASFNKTPHKYVVCNADEGDPGAFMDRSVLEGDPHAVLEAMCIAGYAINAHQGYIYVRAEYPIAVHRLQIAIKQAREFGLLGEDIFGTGFSFDIDVRLGAGAFVCGEETALLTSIEGNRGEPKTKPPFPANKGLFGQPTIINNVETLANIPQIILKGAGWFASMGTEDSKGTKVFALGGKIVNTGLVEVPLGTTLRQIIYDIGGGIPGGKQFKAVQTGGPSGGCIPAQYLDVPIDYGNLQKIGAMMGSGGMIVLDEDECTACRIGTRRLLEMLDKITSGNGTLEDLDKMEELCHYIQKNSLCALGQTAPNPVLSTLKYFRDEYVAHVVDKRCPAGVCKKLMRYTIEESKCKGCTACARKCPVGAISGRVREPHFIDPVKCIKCGACMETCRFGAIVKK